MKTENKTEKEEQKKKKLADALKKNIARRKQSN